MIRPVRLTAVGVMVALSLAACGRTTASSVPAVDTIYGGGVALADVSSILGDTSNWAPGPPTFGVRPLNSSTISQQEKLRVVLRFTHIGTAEKLNVSYRVLVDSVIAGLIVDNIQAAVTPVQGAKAGDQVLYFNENLLVGAAPYASQALVRVGQTVALVEWDRRDSFASSSDMGKLAVKIAKKLKDALSARVKPTPAPTPQRGLLPPLGTDITLLGTTQLPATVLSQMAPLPSALAPGTVAGMLTGQMTYGDYALNDDVHMEVRTAAFVFQSSIQAQSWLDDFFGKVNLDQQGNFFNYDSSAQEYEDAFAMNNVGVVFVCTSSADLEAATKACEAPMQRISLAWRNAVTFGS